LPPQALKSSIELWRLPAKEMLKDRTKQDDHDQEDDAGALMFAGAVLACYRYNQKLLCQDEGCPHAGLPHICISRKEDSK
jgi:hypothetical protein